MPEIVEYGCHRQEGQRKRHNVFVRGNGNGIMTRSTINDKTNDDPYVTYAWIGETEKLPRT